MGWGGAVQLFHRANSPYHRHEQADPGSQVPVGRSAWLRHYKLQAASQRPPAALEDTVASTEQAHHRAERGASYTVQHIHTPTPTHTCPGRPARVPHSVVKSLLLLQLDGASGLRAVPPKRQPANRADAEDGERAQVLALSAP